MKKLLKILLVSATNAEKGRSQFPGGRARPHGERRHRDAAAVRRRRVPQARTNGALRAAEHPASPLDGWLELLVLRG